MKKTLSAAAIILIGATGFCRGANHTPFFNVIAARGQNGEQILQAEHL
jgi:hypothetical protein